MTSSKYHRQPKRVNQDVWRGLGRSEILAILKRRAQKRVGISLAGVAKIRRYQCG